MDKVDITVIGAGVVGLAVASRLAASGKYQVLLLEKNSGIGQETSSRNSEVIHSGIYYPTNSKKASLCVRGNSLLYDLCRKYSIPYKNLGKIVVAASENETAQLEDLRKNGIANEVEGLELLNRSQLIRMEPEIKAEAGLLVPSTGIIDSHSLMNSLFAEFKKSDGMAVFGSEVTNIEKGQEYVLTTGNKEYSFRSSIVVNCAGLGCEKIAALAGINTSKANYKIHYCKGDYFRIRPRLNISKLIYPVPAPAVHNLGIHITIDLTGGMRLGPSAYYVDTLNYSFGPTGKDDFLLPAKVFIPNLSSADLYPDTSGIRPKLQGPGEPFRDFVITNEKDRNLPNFINLLGIESPGLTSCLSIAELVEKLIL